MSIMGPNASAFFALFEDSIPPYALFGTFLHMSWQKCYFLVNPLCVMLTLNSC